MTNEQPLDKKFQPFFPLSFLDGHRDGRFYKDIIVSSKKRHRLLLNCFKQFTYFAAENNLTYWLVHGALIGWFWNELLLPWDMDLDIMVLHYDLAHMYKKFDKTVYNNRYLFEINPNSQYREFQVTDVIDARFIDKLSGLYIDITAASYDPVRKELHCKSPHYYKVDDIFPIRKANFSHTETWVPNKSLVMLEKDYGKDCMTNKEFERGERFFFMHVGSFVPVVLCTIAHDFARLTHILDQRSIISLTLSSAYCHAQGSACSSTSTAARTTYTTTTSRSGSTTTSPSASSSESTLP